MTLWQYFDSETSSSDTQQLRCTEMDGRETQPSVSDDTSESWCSVHHPNVHVVKPEPLNTFSAPINAQQRVTSWLEKYHQVMPGSVRYEQGKAAVSIAKSDISLVDFLQCSAPFRPSFMDRKLQKTRSLVITPKKQQPNVHDRQTKSSTIYDTRRRSLVCDRKEVEWDAQTTAVPGDAEFLSHAFDHFVAFQPLDFVKRRELSACATIVDHHDDGNELDYAETVRVEEHEQNGLWSYFSGVLDDLTRDITFIQ
ncbi:hypothetical protein H4R99_001421 [Coemansia sp. RSA 1722]|nr:hypothetical protein IWW45_001519 [Coemansia sp. RSA 485]KAJ2601652.1 hypothetical protein GGF39_001132 [Coemansia sp. RSA 1721]KAJ2605018.1 hypothetical protein H4R99_001421 [Coemansia sp. RSA 1722]KAJ2638940.1 hypothetical protein GGF40_001271 [Coemansia sp. RSA 1286]